MQLVVLGRTNSIQAINCLLRKVVAENDTLKSSGYELSETQVSTIMTAKLSPESLIVRVPLNNPTRLLRGRPPITAVVKFEDEWGVRTPVYKVFCLFSFHKSSLHVDSGLKSWVIRSDRMAAPCLCTVSSDMC